MIEITTKILALMVAIIGHEIMHGYVAYKYGDSTAKDAGRLNINPIVHIDLVGTIIVPSLLFLSGAPFLFGWAKPVPVNMQTVINNGGYNAGIAVSLAGIAYNFFIAIIGAILISNFSFQQGILIDELIGYFIIHTIIFNIVLGIFNLWPIPPLDGSNALSFLGLKFGIYKIAELNGKIGNYGMIILMLILATPLSSLFFYPVQKIIQILL
jgi:Zn-dependent protease